MHDVIAASLHVPPPLARHAAAAGSWQRQLAFAHEELRAGARANAWPLFAAPPEREQAGELESCGVPQAAAAGQHARQSAAPAPAPAPAGFAENDSSAAQTQLPERACEHAPVRVHVDRHDVLGTTVWLGLDGSQQRVGDHAARIVTGLRQALLATPERLAAVVCNGATVYAAAAPVLARTQRPCSVFATASLKDLP